MYNKDLDPSGSDCAMEWDAGNILHVARHRVTPSEVEEVFRNQPSVRGHDRVDSEDRWTAVGATNSLRVLVVVFTMRGEKIRPVTAWNADRRAKKEYFRAKGIER